MIDYFAKFDNTLYPLYPMAGYRLEFNARKEGLGGFNDVDNTWISISVERHTPIIHSLIFSNKIKIKVNLQNNPLPYFLNNAIGYRFDNITGYQLYVLDGKDFYYLIMY